MVNLAQVEALDLLLWVGNGQQAGRISSLSQPTISRGAHHVARTLGLSLQKVCSEWHVAGDSSSLALERQLQQLGRLEGRGPLRLEAGAVSSRALADPPLPSWVLGRPDAINQPRSLDLVRQRVIDAWICTSALDLPEESGQEVTVLELFRAPLQLVASAQHPLAQEQGLRATELVLFPSVALEGNWYPRSAAQLQEQGLWRDPRRLNHYRSRHWEGRTADGQTLAYASPLMLMRNPSLHPLDFDLGVQQSVALVVLSEIADHQRIQELLQTLQQRVGLLQPGEAMAPCAA